MENKPYKDKIESFFKQKSGQIPPRIEEDDMFFDVAWENIQKKSAKPKTNYWLQWSSILLAALLLWQPLILTTQIKQNHKATTDNSGNIIASAAGISKSTMTNSNKSTSNEIEPADVKHQDLPTAQNDKTKQEKYGQTVKSTVLTPRQAPRTEETTMSVINKPKVVFKNRNSDVGSENIISESLSIETALIEQAVKNRYSDITVPVELLSSQVIPSAKSEKLYTFQTEKTVNNPEPKTANLEWNLGLFARTTFYQFSNNQHLEYSNGVNHLAEASNYREIIIIGEVTWGQHIFGIGAGWGQQDISSSYNLSVGFTHQGEFTDGQGNLHNQYNHTLPTLSGNIDMSHVLWRMPTEIVSEGEQVNFDLKMSHQLVTVPLHLRYDYLIPMYDRWNISFGGTILPQWNKLSKDIRDVNLISHHQKVHHNYTESHVQPNTEITTWSLAATGRVGIHYQWSEWRVFTNLEYQSDIIAPRWFDKQEISNSFLATQLGIVYQL